MQKEYFIAGDWGTSNLRLYLCRLGENNITQLIDTRFGPGVNEVNGDFEDRFFNLAQGWLDQCGALHVIISGMAGSNIGWKEAQYLTCPVGVEQISKGRVAFVARGIEFSILAGLRTVNPLGEPDVMRGEEMQLLGWMLSNPENAKQDRLFALPGTHNKWTKVRNGQIDTFLTAFTGELFALLRKKSILISDDNAFSFNEIVFMEGVKSIEASGGIHLMHILFSVRSRQVLGEMDSANGLSYLSGLLIGADILGAIEIFGKPAVTVIGTVALAEKYQIALNYFGLATESCNPTEIAITGFTAIYNYLYAGSKND